MVARNEGVMPDSTPRIFDQSRLVAVIRKICMLQNNYLEVRRKFRADREQQIEHPSHRIQIRVCFERLLSCS